MHLQSSLQHQAYGGLLITFNRSYVIGQPECIDVYEGPGQFCVSPLVELLFYVCPQGTTG